MYYQVLPDEARVVRPGKARKKSFAAHHLEIRMFHVGHGECILVVFPNKDCWLVDCASGTGKRSNESLAEGVAAYLKDNALQLTAIIPTHPHSDHARAFTALLNNPLSNITNPLTIFRSNDPGWHDPKKSEKRKKKKWLVPYRVAAASFGDKIVMNDERLSEPIAARISAELFSGIEGDIFYNSLFVQLRFRGAKILFTGDAYKSYEQELRDGFGAEYFRADLLKITHHGSEGGTDEDVLRDIRPGIAIASTGDDGGHRLEDETRDHILAGGPRVRVFETYRDQKQNVNERDIIIETDGLPIVGKGILYRVRQVAPALNH
jgi:competence protein ComEC